MNSNNNNNFRSNYYNDDVNIENNNQNSSNLRINMQNSLVNNKINENSNVYQNVSNQQTLNKSPKKKKNFSFKKIFFSGVAAFLIIVIIFFAISWIMSLFVPQKTNFLIMATDQEGTRTDTIMLGTFDKSSKHINIMSIPRDTYITVSDENFTKMNEEYPQPGSKSMKINTVHHYGGSKYGVNMLKDEVERLTGINIDFYVKVDFDAFRYIIDSIGGIEFYVPQDMQYSDPYQDLYIDLKQGNQILNGKQAEHLLRYRSGYANADLGRIKVQQDFMKAFFSQTLSKGTIIKKPGVFVKAIFKYDYVDTDAGVFDVASYAMVLGDINSENIKTYTLPGYSTMVNGQSVYKPNAAEILNLVSEFNNN